MGWDWLDVVISHGHGECCVTTHGIHVNNHPYDMVARDNDHSSL